MSGVYVSHPNYKANVLNWSEETSATISKRPANKERSLSPFRAAGLAD